MLMSHGLKTYMTLSIPLDGIASITSSEYVFINDSSNDKVLRPDIKANSSGKNNIFKPKFYQQQKTVERNVTIIRYNLPFCP